MKRAGRIMKEWLIEFRNQLLYTSFLILIVFVIGYSFVSPNVAMTLSTVGTLVLASVAVWSISDNRSRDKRRRDEDLAREARDRKERALNEMSTWIKDIQLASTNIKFAPGEIVDVDAIANMNLNIKFAYAGALSTAPYLKALSKELSTSYLI